jgi:predicted nuclease of predicted toxin-antitoxin system
MRVLLDECLPRRLGRHLPGHEARTVADMGWRGLKNGALLQQAAEHFDAFLIVDQNIEYQQNLSCLPLPVVVLEVRSNDIDVIRPLMPKALEVLSAIRPGLHKVC